MAININYEIIQDEDKGATAILIKEAGMYREIIQIAVKNNTLTCYITTKKHGCVQSCFRLVGEKCNILSCFDGKHGSVFPEILNYGEQYICKIYGYILTIVPNQSNKTEDIFSIVKNEEDDGVYEL